MLAIESVRTLMDVSERPPRGLQNRLRGAVEASWVGSIPIHPRQFWPVSADMTAKVTAKTANGFLNRLPSRHTTAALLCVGRQLTPGCC